MRKAFGVSRETLSRMLRVTGRAVARWEKAESLPKAPEDMERLPKPKEIMELGLSVYTLQGLQSLLGEAQPVFEGKTGIDLLAFGDYERVLSAIRSISATVAGQMRIDGMPRGAYPLLGKFKTRNDR